MFNGKQINSAIPPTIVGGNLYNDNKDKTKTFNSLFTRILSVENHKPHLPPLPMTMSYNLDHIIIYDSDARDILTQLKLSKASGPDGFNHKLLKEGAPFLVETLKLLFHLSLQEKIFPTSWKNSNIIPLFKKLDASNIENYRPISLLSCLRWRNVTSLRVKP